MSTTVAVAASMTDKDDEHQFVTRTLEPSGVTATYFGTAPTSTTRVIVRVATSIS